jgi:ABC-2 type transport system ATP-binding protein
MQSGHAVETAIPALAAGVGVRRGPGWALRSASFRLDPAELGSAALGVVASRQDAALLIDLLSGRLAAGYGILQVLGQDMSTVRGRSAARRRVGIFRRGARPRPGLRIRGLVEHAARQYCQPGDDRHLLVAAILDRLTLTPWAGVPLRSAPDLVARRAGIAAAAVHQPDLLLADGLLDDLPAPELAVLVDVIHDLERDAALLITGRDAEALGQACAEVLACEAGILVGSRPRHLPLAGPHSLARHAYCD